MGHFLERHSQNFPVLVSPRQSLLRHTLTYIITIYARKSTSVLHLSRASLASQRTSRAYIKINNAPLLVSKFIQLPPSFQSPSLTSSSPCIFGSTAFICETSNRTSTHLNHNVRVFSILMKNKSLLAPRHLSEGTRGRCPASSAGTFLPLHLVL